MEIKVDLSGLSKRVKKLDETIKLALTREPLLKEIGETAIKDIQFQTRRGINGEDSSKLKPLTRDWVKRRGDLAKRGVPTHAAFSKGRSNLTITGQLLDSIKIKIIKGATVMIGFTGMHKGYSIPYLSSFKRKTKDGTQLVNSNRSGMTNPGDEISNAELASHISKSRPFFSIRPEMINRFKSIVIRYIRRNIK